MGDAYSFGAWVRRRRRQLDLTQVALAARIGVAAVTVQKLEADERRPSRQVAALLATVLHIPEPERETFLAAARGERVVDRLAAVDTGDAIAADAAPPLPAPLTTLIGRSAETAELRAWLAGPARLVTLTGAGGSGKTRLAAQVARDLRDTFPGGVWFVDLAPVSDSAEVVPAIAAALHVLESPARSLRDGLLAWARDRQALLVLDNFEQVVDAAPLVHALLGAGPGLRALVTSRVPLRLDGEREYPVAPLALPVSATMDSIAESPAIQLFVERAAAVAPSFRLTEANASAVAEICTALDGLPLAIELAAARVRTFPPAALLAQIQRNRFTALGSGARTLPDRQRTIHAAIDWSYRLLGPAEQRLLAGMGVFVGGCDLDALEAVCGSGEDLIDALDGLVAHALVRAVDDGSAVRYTLLETVREYALERLRESGEEETVVARHAEHFIQLAEQAEPQLRGPDELAWLDRLENEHANMLAVLVRSRSLPNPATAQRAWSWRLAAALWMYWHSRGHIQIWRTWVVERIADVAEAPTRLRGQLTLSATAFLGTYERDADGSRLYHEALSLFKAVGDQWRQAEMLGGWWSVGRGAIGDYIERVSIEQMFLADQLGDPWLRADSRIARGAALTAAGRFDEARPALDRGLELARTVGNPSQIAWVLLECGRHALTTANLPQARVLFSERLAITRRLRDTLGNAISLWALGTVASYTGDIEAGRRIHLERLQYELHLGHAPGIADSYNSLAEIELSAGDLTQAETYAAQGHEIAHVVEDVALLKSLIMRADIMLYQGKLDRAEQLAREAEAQARRLNDTDRQIFALVCLSQIALQRAAPEWARACFLEASAYDDFYVYQLESPTFCEVAGACLAANVRPREAASLWGAAEAIRERHGTPLLPVHRPLYEQRLTTARQLLPPEEWDAVWEAGRALTWHAALRQAVAYLQDATGAADG